MNNGERKRESESETLRGVMSGSVWGMHGLNWDTEPIHITAAKNRFPCTVAEVGLHCSTRLTGPGHSYYQQHTQKTTHTCFRLSPAGIVEHTSDILSFLYEALGLRN